TVDEAGVPALHMSIWSAIWAPKGTPKDIIARLNAAVMDALADPTARSQLADLGQEIFPRDQQTPQALFDFHKAEIEKWWPIIKPRTSAGAGSRSRRRQRRCAPGPAPGGRLFSSGRCPRASLPSACDPHLLRLA